MDYSVWRIDGADEVEWDAPLSQEDAEKVRWVRQRDADAEAQDNRRAAVLFEVRPAHDLSKQGTSNDQTRAVCR